MRKRAVAVDFTVILVITIITIMALFGGVYAYLKIIKKGGALEACRLSVINADRFKMMGQTPVNIECPRNELTIGYSDTELNDKFHKDSALQLIADEMNNCWYKMGGEKQLNPYEQDLVMGPREVCLICSEISFDEEIRDNVDTVTGLRDYLDRIGYLQQWAEPLKVRKEHFILGMGTGITTESSVEALREIDEFDTKLDYFVVYMTFSNAWLTDSQSVPNVLADSILSDKFKFLGSADSYSIMYVIPSNDFSYLDCDTVKG
jgi:hypothetical protein